MTVKIHEAVLNRSNWNEGFTTVRYQYHNQYIGGRGASAMASTKAYLDFILDQLSGLDEITYRAMMGEYIIYYRGRIVGGVYDDRFLVKPTKSAAAMMPDAERELPYEGAKEMLLVDNVDDREFLQKLLEAMYKELPAPKSRKSG